MWLRCALDAYEGITGNDVNGWRPCRYAIRENIEKDIEHERVKLENPDSMEEDAPDPVPSITRAHFEEAMKYARRSVSDADIRKYQVWQPFPGSALMCAHAGHVHSIVAGCDAHNSCHPGVQSFNIS